jgi:hypothetical protein
MDHELGYPLMKTQYLWDQYSMAVQFAKTNGWNITFRIRGKKEYVIVKTAGTLKPNGYYYEFRKFRDDFLPNAVLTSQSSLTGFTARLNPEWMK